MNEAKPMHDDLLKALLPIIPRTVYQDIRRLNTLVWAMVGPCLRPTMRLDAWADIDLMQATVNGRRPEPRMQEVEEISRVLKVIARELHIPVLVVAQLLRAVESHPLEKSRFSELRGGFLDHDADLMLILYHREPQDDPRVKIIVAKQRHGPLADLHVHFQPERTHFRDFILISKEEYERSIHHE